MRSVSACRAGSRSARRTCSEISRLRVGYATRSTTSKSNADAGRDVGGQVVRRRDVHIDVDRDELVVRRARAGVVGDDGALRRVEQPRHRHPDERRVEAEQRSADRDHRRPVDVQVIGRELGQVARRPGQRGAEQPAERGQRRADLLRFVAEVRREAENIGVGK